MSEKCKTDVSSTELISPVGGGNLFALCWDVILILRHGLLLSRRQEYLYNRQEISLIGYRMKLQEVVDMWTF